MFPLRRFLLRIDFQKNRWIFFNLFVFLLFVSIQLFFIFQSYALVPKTLVSTQETMAFASISANFTSFAPNWTLFLGTLAIVLAALLVLFNYFLQAHTASMKDFKYQIVNNLTHELQTPVTIATMALQNIGDKYQTAQVEDLPMIRRYLVILRDGIASLQGLSKKLVEALELRAGLAQINLQPFDLIEIVQLALQNLQAKIDASKGQILWDYEPSETYMALVDAKFLRIALENILENSIKYSPDRLIIKIIVQPMKNYWVLQLQDQGIGIPQTELHKIFKRFYRANEGGEVQNTRGYGLGLSYVRDIIQLHPGAKLAIQSQVGQGTTIIIKIKKYE